jgi:hypothetical protein
MQATEQTEQNNAPISPAKSNWFTLKAILKVIGKALKIAVKAIIMLVIWLFCWPVALFIHFCQFVKWFLK